MRQYDASEVKRLFPEYARGEDCLIILVHEGPAVRTAAEMAECAEIAADTGCETAPEEVVLQWLEERNHVPTLESFLEEGIIVDTVEIAANWKKIAPDQNKEKTKKGESYEDEMYNQNHLHGLARFFCCCGIRLSSCSPIQSAETCLFNG